MRHGSDNLSEDRLGHATRSAVEKSAREMAKITTRIGRLTDLLHDGAASARASSRHGVDDGPTARFARQLDLTRDKVAELVERQSQTLHTFNIVLFGRTGSGKSTLISAMTRGDGASVSQGESDWTTQVKPTHWRSCEIYDTPGINGWGRTESRSNLEERARAAVEIADFVVVCFDSQSQQADEFRKLAAWVQTYRKPLIAVLNPRNAVWRVCPRVPIGSARANLSRAVREHAGNIRDELAKIGLSGVPVVAVNSKRALFARASMPFLGPDEVSLHKQRTQFGVEQLEQWSGFPRLEELLVAAISEHAVPLRLGALNDQLRGVLGELDHALAEIGDETNRAAVTLEHDLIRSMLRLFGYPPRHDAERRRPFLRGGTDLLAELERRRGGTFQAPVEGEFRQLIHQRLDVELGTLRSRSLHNAEECVVASFDRRTNTTAEAVTRASFDQKAMKRAAEKVLNEGSEFLSKRVELAHRDVRLDIKVLAHAAALRGNAGSGWKYSAWAIRAGGVLAGTLATLGVLAATNFWNPLGWAAAVGAGVGLIASAASALLGWLGGRARKKAESQRLAARGQALAQVRRSVHQVYDGFRDEVLSEAHRYAVDASGPLVRPPIEQALDLRVIEKHCTTWRAELRGLTASLSRTKNPQHLLSATARTLELQAYPNSPNRSQLQWLGEDWINDPNGLKQARGSSGTGRTTAYDPDLVTRLFGGIRQVFDQVFEDLKPGTGRAWLDGALARCAGDPEAIEALGELTAMAEDGRPRIHLVGDYNAGKSSFIKRLLIDAGSPVPESLEIRADPTTDRVREYDWGGVRLIDSPGFQSGEASHAERALRAFPDASAIIYLFQPNLVLGDDGDVLTVLRGDKNRGLAPKLQRTFFVINRSDELGVDPETDPKAYAQLASRKRTELSLALEAREVTVEPGSIFCMASDPFGLVGNRTDVDASAFDAYRQWDGFDHFMAAFQRSQRRFLRSGVDRSLLEGGLARIARLETRQRAAVEQLKNRELALGRVQAQIGEAIAKGARIGGKYHAELHQLVAEHAAGFRDEVLRAGDADQLTRKAKEFQHWWDNEALQVELSQWGKRAAEELNGWQVSSFEAIGRRLKSAEFRAAFAEHDASGPDAPNVTTGTGWIGLTARAIGRVMGKASEEFVLGATKMVGVEFAPATVTKFARFFGKASTILMVVGVAADIADIWQGERTLAKHEEARQRIAAFLSESVSGVVKTVAYGSAGDPGLLQQLGDELTTLAQIASQQRADRNQLAVAFRDVQGRLAIYTSLRASACAQLGQPLEMKP